MNSKTIGPFDLEDDGMDDLVRLFQDLRRDVGEQKAETARLYSSLCREQEERMADTAKHEEERMADIAKHEEVRMADIAKHKEETAGLYRLLLLEEEKRKDENKNLAAETKRLKAALTGEREERKGVVAHLEETIEHLEETIEHLEETNKQQDAKLKEFERELKSVNEQHDKDIRDISEVCTTSSYVPFSPPLSPHLLSISSSLKR